MNEINFMEKAISLAKKAEKIKEVPVGAVIVKDGKIVAKGYNKREKGKCATAHAEMIAIKRACKKLKSWRLNDCEIYVTMEPCPMCCGALINARIEKINFGAFDQKAGCCGSVVNLCEVKEFNHHPEVNGGIMEKECSEILTNFFVKLRKRKNSK